MAEWLAGWLCAWVDHHSNAAAESQSGRGKLTRKQKYTRHKTVNTNPFIKRNVLVEMCFFSALIQLHILCFLYTRLQNFKAFYDGISLRHETIKMVTFQDTIMLTNSCGRKFAAGAMLMNQHQREMMKMQMT